MSGGRKPGLNQETMGMAREEPPGFWEFTKQTGHDRTTLGTHELDRLGKLFRARAAAAHRERMTSAYRGTPMTRERWDQLWLRYVAYRLAADAMDAHAALMNGIEIEAELQKALEGPTT